MSLRGIGQYYCNNGRCPNSEMPATVQVFGRNPIESYFICPRCKNKTRLEELKKFYDGKTGDSTTKVDKRRSLFRTS